MATPYKHKRSATAGKTPVAGDFADGEILVNTADGRAFVRKGAGVATLPNVDDNNGRYIRHDTASQGLNSTQQGNAQINIGATAVGSALFTAGSAAAARTTLGAQAALGYTPVNRAGDTMTGSLGTQNVTMFGSGSVGGILYSRPYNNPDEFFFAMFCQDVTGSHIEGRLDVRNGVSSTPYVFKHDGNFYAPGSINGASKNFLIDHPLDPLARNLRHASIEAPELMVQYRGVATLTDGRATVDIDAACGMSPGTFAALTVDAVVQSLMPQDSFERVKCSGVAGGSFTITSEDAGSDATVAWLVTARRNDAWVLFTDTTDEDGRLIVEEPKREVV